MNKSDEEQTDQATPAARLTPEAEAEVRAILNQVARRLMKERLGARCKERERG